MSEFNTDLPSIRLVQSYIKSKEEVNIKLMTGELLTGKLFWQDPNCICLRDQDDKPILIWRQGLMYLKSKDE